MLIEPCKPLNWKWHQPIIEGFMEKPQYGKEKALTFANLKYTVKQKKKCSFFMIGIGIY